MQSRNDSVILFTLRTLALFGTLQVFLPLSSTLTFAKTIRIASDPWCPYVCDPSTGKPGIINEITQAILSKEPNGEQNELKIEVIAWARAIEMARTSKIEAISGAFKSDAPDFIFPSEAQATTTNCIFGYTDKNSKASSKLTIHTLDDLKNKHVGIIQGYSYGKELDDKIANKGAKDVHFEMASGTESLNSNFKKLIAGRLDFIIEEKNVLKYFLNGRRESESIYTAYCMVPEKTYIAFSPHPALIESSKKYALRLSLGMEKLRKSGELTQILRRYGIDDNPK